MDDSDLVQVTTANWQFAKKFYAIVSKEKTGNVLFSPISAHAVLSMVYQGAAGKTADSFASTLHVSNQKVAANGYNNVMAALNNVENVTLHIANKIYVARGFALNNNFKESIAQKFLSETEIVDFAFNGKAADTINEWVENNTNAKIKDLILPEYLGGSTRLVLVNAVYFKGKWAHPFEKCLTITETFYISNDANIDCQMMQINKCFNYREDENLDAKILEMKYKNDNVSMVIVLPNTRDGIADLESKLETVDLSTLTHQMTSVNVAVSLPRFKIETDMDLKEILTKMGLGVIFSSEANFSQISENSESLLVTKAIQKAFIEVNEEGAEATAATALVIKECLVRTRYRFVADHPFLVVIQIKHDFKINHIFFYGKVTNPIAIS